jgi:hypothetical protein
MKKARRGGLLLFDDQVFSSFYECFALKVAAGLHLPTTGGC